MLSVLSRLITVPRLQKAYLPWVVVPLLVACGGSGGVPLAAASRLGSGKAATIPSALRAAYIASVQTDASANPAYRVDPASRTAHNPRQKLAAHLDEAGIRLVGTAGQEDFHATLALASYGCAAHPVAKTPVLPRATHNRVEYVRPGLTEWYVNGPLGVEQGFTLATALGCAEKPGVVVNLDWDTNLSPALVPVRTEGLAPEQTAIDQRLELRNQAGQVLLAYSDLYAYDALGNKLPARLTLAGRRLSLHVDDRGAQYPVTIDPLIWSQQSKLLSSDGVTGDTFASSVAISGDTAIIGDPFHDVATNSGTAYVFVRNNAQWTQQQRLMAADYSSNDNFGTAVAISGDTALVGAPNKFSLATGAGQVYVYLRTGTTWNEQARLTATGAAANDFFGRSVSLDQDTAVVGAPGADLPGQLDAGAAYAFTRVGTTWTQQQKLTALDALATDAFGSSVSLSGNTAVVGSPKDDTVGGVDAGSAYVFFRTGAAWAQQQQLFAMDGAITDLFGSAVAISMDTAVIGSPQADTVGGANAGAAYVFLRTGTVWAGQQKLIAADGALNDNLAAAVAVAGDTAVLGAALANPALGGTDAGAAYVWTRSGTAWTLQMKLTASDALTGDQLGGAVAVSVDTVLAGAPMRTESFARKGAAYVFFRGLSTGDPCATPSQCVSNICLNSTCRSGKVQGLSCLSAGECASNFCVDGVCCDTACGDGQPDCQACSVTAGAAVNGTCRVSASGQQCRAKANDCDTAETCDGATPTCPTDVGLADGMPCAFGVCSARLCTADGPLAFVPPPGASGSQATGCALVTMQNQAHAAAVAGLLSLLVLALLLRSRRSAA